MSRYIDADARDVTATSTSVPYRYRQNGDVVEVHGKWVWTEDGVRCSRCNFKLQTTGLSNYCPNCGADMRGEI